MREMKALSIARKTLLEYLREPLLLGLLFVFPIMMLGFYYVAFGDTEQGLAQFLNVWVVNEDAGGTATEGERWQAGAQLIQVLRQVEWEGEAVFDVAVVKDRRTAEITVRERKAALLLVIPPDFSQALLDGPETAAPAVVSLVGYPNADNFVFAQSIVEALVREFSRFALGWGEDAVSVDYEFLPGTGTMSDFDFGVPGMIVFGIMFVTITTATTLVRENVSGTLARLRLTRISARDLLLGVALAQMVIAFVMVPVTFGAALLMGFQSHGSLLLATGVGLLLSLSAVGLGLMTVCFVRTESEAANLAATVGVLMVIVSGAMYPMPDVPIATVAGRTVQLYDLLPSTHAAEAMRRVLVLGEGLGAIGYELFAMSLLAVVILAAGVGLYQRMQLRKT
jgi:ABC-type multidrug transport system permease subunit